MNCEALAFVAAQLHAAKCVQRYKCSEIAQALKESHICLLVSFVISWSSYINSLFQIVRRLNWIVREDLNGITWMCTVKTIRHSFHLIITTRKDHPSCIGPKTRY